MSARSTGADSSLERASREPYGASSRIAELNPTELNPMSGLRTVLSTATLLLPCALLAQPMQDWPAKGMLFSPSKPAALKYECKSTSESRITCSFMQLDVYKVQFPSVESSLSTSWATTNERRCAEASRELEDLLKENPNALARPKGRIKNEDLRSAALKASVDYCRTGNREVWREYLTLERDRQQKTCTISAHSYLQTFHRDSRGPNGLTRWITEEQPYGECRLHREAQFTIDNNNSWSYSARYRVMNKSGRQGALICEEMKEQEVTYASTRNEEAGWTECETVRFQDGCYSPEFPCLGGPPAIVH